jgi:hypothetical protein
LRGGSSGRRMVVVPALGRAAEVIVDLPRGAVARG